MAATTPRGRGTSNTTRKRRVHPLVIVIPIIAAALVLIIALNSRTGGGGAQSIAQLATQDVHALLWSPTDANTVFFGHHDGMLVSRDRGATWQPASLTGADAMSLGAAASDPQRIYAAGHGVFLSSRDGGATWAPVAGPLQNADLHGFAVSPNDANRLYALVEGQGLLTSGDGGATWRPLPNGPSPIRALVAGAGQTVYAGSIGGTVFVSEDGGNTWQQTNLGMGGDVTSLAYEPRSGDLYAAAVMTGSNQGMLHRLAAGRSSWEMHALNGMGVPLTIGVSPHDSTTLLLVNSAGAVFRSADRGATWATQ